MGTRNLTMVVLDGEYKVAQYSQWDGYPSGQGETVLRFILDKLGGSSVKTTMFKLAINKCKFLTDQEIKNKWIECGADPNHDMVGMEVSNKFKQNYPELYRDSGAGVLSLIQNGVSELQDSIDFAADSLFCEWAYLLDLDNEVLEIYKGFVKEPLEEKDRFYYLQGQCKKDYFPVRLLSKIPFDKLKADTMEILQREMDEEED